MHRPNPTREEWVEIAGGSAATLASLFWNTRAGGLIGGGTAVYSALRGHTTRGAILGVLSGLVFFSPEIRQAFGSNGLAGLGAASEKPPPQLPPTRQSCIECVDKHLGAALVLLSETRDGYPHRLRAIGHLHEAEDESQAWPELHTAIREARKHFQHTGSLPDFAALETLASRIRGR